MQSKSAKAKATTITCVAPDAQSVFIAGTFNAWEPDTTAMTKSKDGVWKVRLNLLPDRYEFKFIIDGQWCCGPNCQGDHSCTKCVTNKFGTMNRVLEVA